MLLPLIPALVSLSFADPFSFEYPGQTEATGATYLVVVANDDIPAFEVKISGDGQTITKKVPALKSGGKHKITWKQKSASAKYQLVIDGGEMSADFAFEMVKPAAQGKVGKLKVKSSREDVVKRRQATYETSFALTNYEYKVYDSDANVIAQKLVTDNPIAAGGEFTVKWDSRAEVFMVWVRGEDEHGRFTEFKLVPWAVEIPHTEINFDSAKFDVKSDETAKLDEAVAVAFHELDGLEKVNEAVQANITPKLYIVGYTDTVGPGPMNDELSRNRAKAIAKYFFDKGFWAEIYYQGMGERALRVQTDDNVDEVRNRRALYLIGVDNPPPGGQVPAQWKKLSGARTRPVGFILPALPPEWAKQREERRAGTGGEAEPGGADGGTPPEGSEGGAAEGGASNEPVGDAQLPEGVSGGPPTVEGEPGATKKGCSVVGYEPGLDIGALALLVIGAIGKGRRRVK
ncbi:MAG TPA: OmpA family protein [Nannocystaceae bacterium]|nr:OmpA family protein [Nannocystaceae bacterium]